MSSSTRHRTKILNFLVCLVLIDKAESPAIKNEIHESPGSIIWGRQRVGGGPGLGSFDDHDTRKIKTSFTRALLQMATQSPSQVQPGCDLRIEEVQRLYNASSRQWLISDNVLEEFGNDVQALVECANENDTILFVATSTIKPARTLILSQNLTLASRSEQGSTGNGVPFSAPEMVRLTCPDSGQLILSRSPSLTLRNIVIDECNTNTSVIQLDPNCTTEGTTRRVRFHSLIIQRNVMFRQGSLINSSNARCLQLELNNVSIRQNRCLGPCILLSGNNALNSIALVRNKRSRRNFEDSSIFALTKASETVALNVRSENNSIRSFQLGSGTLRIANSHFIDNTRNSSVRGGVLLANQSTVSIFNTIFERNYAMVGGGVAAWASNVNINECIFRANEASYGGSLHLSESSIAIVSGSRFFDSRATLEAGAIYLNDGVELSVRDSIFKGNHAGRHGGALSLWNFCNATTSNCIFTNNTSDNDGGAIRVMQNSTTTLTYSIFQGNKARVDGGALSLWNFCNADAPLLKSKY